MIVLYKYLDVKGGLLMLENHNLQFTNATKFNDPFDCHPALFDYSHAPINKNNWPPVDFLTRKGKSDMENMRNHTWICCLSKVYDSLLMWAYYNNHKGICIGLNKEAVLNCCQRGFWGMMPPHFLEVKYRDILQKPDYFKPDADFWNYLLCTKAKAWEHEQEVRLITKDPAWIQASRSIPVEIYKDADANGDEYVDGKEIRHYPPLTADCFESVYLGVNMLKRNKTKIIEIARKINHDIKIYQMTIDPEAFRLKAEQIQNYGKETDKREIDRRNAMGIGE